MNERGPAARRHPAQAGQRRLETLISLIREKRDSDRPVAEIRELSSHFALLICWIAMVVCGGLALVIRAVGQVLDGVETWPVALVLMMLGLGGTASEWWRKRNRRRSEGGSGNRQADGSANEPTGPDPLT